MTMRPDRRHDAGFTLLEVTVALAVAALVLLGARAVLERMGDGADAIAAHAEAADRAANGERTLRALAGRLEVPPGEEEAFAGTPRAARFRTWCEVPDGWLERCRAVVGVVRLEDGTALVASLSTGGTVPLLRGLDGAELRYLRDAADGGLWLERWRSAVEAPLAIGVVVPGDTVIVRIGERG